MRPWANKNASVRGRVADEVEGFADSVQVQLGPHHRVRVDITPTEGGDNLAELVRAIADRECDGELLEQRGDGFDRHGLGARSRDDDAPERPHGRLAGLEKLASA